LGATASQDVPAAPCGKSGIDPCHELCILPRLSGRRGVMARLAVCGAALAVLMSGCGALGNRWERCFPAEDTFCVQEDNHKTDGRAMEWPEDWSKHIGQTLTLEGRAVDAKLGALLEGEAGAVWIDGLDQWPQGLCSADGKGKRLLVSGTVVKRDDLPAFVQKPGEPASRSTRKRHWRRRRGASSCRARGGLFWTDPTPTLAT
jgi:hypothetical protein